MSENLQSQPVPAQPPRKGTALWTALLWQVPILLVAGAIYGFYLRLPFSCIDSDSVTFGLMGEDIYKYGNLTTFAYGQNYLFSITPYVYAAFKALLPKTVSWAFILAAAGGLLAMSGLWMIYQSFLSTCRETRRRSWVSAVIFGLLLLAMPKHFFDFGGNASTELSYFTIGLMMWSASRVSAALRGGRPAPGRWWLLFGLSFGYGIFSRIQVCAYGIIPLGLLLWQQGRSPAGRSLLKAAGWFAAGLLIGAAPMLLHGLFRAETWPFAMELGSHWANAAERRQLFRVLVDRVLPVMFSFDGHFGPPTYEEELVILWVSAATLGYFYFLVRRRHEMTPLDHGWFWGPLLVLAIMLTHTHMVVDQSNRRYCLQAVEAMIWLFCRFCVPVAPLAPAGRTRHFRPQMWLAAGLCVLLLLSSLISWRDELTSRRNKNVWGKLARRDLIPELQRQNAVIMANYWDAYILYFLAEGQLRVEAQPWFWVRTYGRITATEMQSNTLWLIRAGDGHSTGKMLGQDLGQAVLAQAVTIPLSNTLMGARCELWRLPDTNAAVRLMQKYHPRYFTTHYPPGSRPEPHAPK